MNKDVHVTVNCRKTGPRAFDFDMELGGTKTDRLEFDKKKDNLPKKDAYDVHFHLVNHDDARVRFVNDETLVMWTKEGEGSCPTYDEYQGGEFTVKKVERDKLKVENRDDTRQLYKFTLNFVDEESGALVSYDPIWDNRNGGI